MTEINNYYFRLFFEETSLAVTLERIEKSSLTYLQAVKLLQLKSEGNYWTKKRERKIVLKTDQPIIRRTR